MSAHGERDFLPIVAIIIALVFAGALTTGVVLWRRQQLASAPLSPPPPPPPPPTATAIAITAPPPLPPPPIPTATPTIAMGSESVEPLASSPIPNVTSAIARLRPGFRSCFNKGLAKDPSLAGSITIAITVAPNGDVMDVTKKSGGLNADVDACIVRKCKSATFDATPSGDTVNIPIHFARAP
jgi:hypothetical protein